MRLLPTKQADKLVQEHVETNGYVDPVTGEPYEPEEPPEVKDPQGDKDAE